MIELIDFKIGILIRYRNEFFEIVSIDSSPSGKIHYSFNPPLRNKDFQIFNPKTSDLISIPLSKEILKALGYNIFIDKNGDIFFNSENFQIVESNGIFNCQVPCTKRIAFIHELQNLFFLLNGKQIDIKNLMTFLENTIYKMRKIETYPVYISDLKQFWEMPIEIATNLTDFLNYERKINEGKSFYVDINKCWYENLSWEQKMMIKKS